VLRYCVAVAFVFLCLRAGSLASTAQDATPVTPSADQKLTAIVVGAIGAPAEVLGSDGLVHLEADLLVTNAFSAPVTLTAVTVLNPDGIPLLKLEGDALVAVTQPLLGGAPLATIPASGTAAVMIDVAVPQDQVPTHLTPRVTYAVPPEAHGASLIANKDIIGPTMAVGRRPLLVIAPPIHGPGWLNANSCCDALSIHRAGRNAVDGDHFVTPETFAIDWVQIRDDRAFSGDGQRVQQWFGYGADITAVAAGTVVFVHDGVPDQPPFTLPPSLAEPLDAGGNQVIIQIAPDVWAFYAHLQPGSVAVEVGDTIAVGQPLGRLGNSGNSLGPHLHFGLLDGPGTMTANSVPFGLDAYTLVGTVAPEPVFELLTGEGVALPVTGVPRPQTGTLPLNLTVTDFP
jgi:hypothetical protein